MNGSTGNKAFGASEKPERGEVFLSLGTAQRMLSLVQRIVEDILENQKALEKLVPEQERLCRQRRQLAWPERQRRYVLQEEITQAERNLEEAREEMQVLGLTVRVKKGSIPGILPRNRCAGPYRRPGGTN